MKNTDPETWNAIQESWYMNPEPEEPENPGKDHDIEKDFELENGMNNE